MTGVPRPDGVLLDDQHRPEGEVLAIFRRAVGTPGAKRVWNSAPSGGRALC